MARITPTPEQWPVLRDAFFSAFTDVPSLQNLIQLEQGENPADIISSGANRPTAVRELLTWAVSGEVLDRLIIHARNVKPTNTRLREIAERFGLAPNSRGLESLLKAGNNLVDIDEFIRNLSKFELAVCRVEIGGAPAGTGFLVGPDLVLTCSHVLETLPAGSDSGDRVMVRFDYKKYAGGGDLQAGVSYGLAKVWKVDASPKNESDYVLMRLSRKAGEESVAGQADAPARGWLNPEAHAFSQGESIFIIQHPLGDPMKISLGNVVSIKSNSTEVCHDVSTQPGSSGSPCFTMDGKVVGLHQHGKDHGSLSCSANGAIRLSEVIARPSFAGALSAKG